MKKYRKKPVVIEAEQYSKEKHIAEGYVPNGVEISMLVDDDGLLYEGTPYCLTLEGRMTVTDGDCIIKGIKGEYYPCKPDIFEQTYDLVGE